VVLKDSLSVRLEDHKYFLLRVLGFYSSGHAGFDVIHHAIPTVNEHNAVGWITNTA